MATCAGCQKPIVTGQKYGLVGTEVFHKACVLSGTARSVGNQQRSKTMELTSEVTTLKRVIERMSRDHAHEISLLKADLREARDAKSVLENQLMNVSIERRTLQVSSTSLKAQLNEMLQDQTELQDDRERAIRERDAARAEAAFHQTIQRGTVPVTATPEPVETEIVRDNRDAAVVRFSLLELDDKT